MTQSPRPIGMRTGTPRSSETLTKLQGSRRVLPAVFSVQAGIVDGGLARLATFAHAVGPEGCGPSSLRYRSISSAFSIMARNWTQ